MRNLNEYFMNKAIEESLNSNDPRTKVGVCIVTEDNKIISVGCNNMPNNCEGKLPWELGEGLNNKHLYVVHAELNAILSSKEDLNRCILYTTLFPCCECAKAIIQAGINEVIYLSDKFKDHDIFKASKHMLDIANITYRQLNII